MDTKTKSLGIAVAIGILSTPAFPVTQIGSTGNKGSALIYSRIDVRGANDTLVTITNDSSGPVSLKCFYGSSDRLTTPNASTAAQLRPTKHFLDFTIELTHNQPISWWAKSGNAVGDSQFVRGRVAPPFGTFPDGANKDAGELKCWAITNDGLAELHYNHLFGTASIWDSNTTQAFEYTAAAFQAMGPSTLTGTTLGSPGVLNLDNVEYDACPNILLGNYSPGGAGRPQTQVTLASCNQDLRQAYTPTITKLTWTFWNQDEQSRTGTHFCADSWYETNFPVAGNAWFQSSYASLGTDAAYFRIETTADQQICGPSATTSAYVGVMNERDVSGNFVRGTNLIGRGTAPGAIQWDVGIPDSFKR